MDAPFAEFADPSSSYAGAEYVEGLKERVLTNSPNVVSRDSAIATAKMQGPAFLRLEILDEETIEHRNDAFGVRRYLLDSLQWPNNDRDAVKKSSQRDNELIGFPNYQGPTELGRLMFVVTETTWTDTIFCGAHAGFKVLQAGTPLMPTGTLPMFCDLDLGEGHRMSEYLGVFPYIAMKLGLLGANHVEENQIHFLEKYVGRLSSEFYFSVCMGIETLGIPPEQAPLGEQFMTYFIPTKEIESVLLTKERIEKLKGWLQEWVSNHKGLGHIDAYLAGHSKFLVGEKVSMADVSLFLEMLRIYGRKIVREAVPDFSRRFPNVVRHFFMMLGEFPQLKTYLQNPNRHYKPAYGFLNQCEAIYSYGDLFDLASEEVETKNVAEDATKNGNPVTSALAAIESAVSVGTDLNGVVVSDDWLVKWPWFSDALKLLGLQVVDSERERTILDLNMFLEVLGEYGAIRFLSVFLASAKGALGLTSQAKAKNMQVISMVIHLMNTYQAHDKAFFKREVLDKKRSGATYSNVSPGNAQYLEVLIEMSNSDGENGVVCAPDSKQMSLADVGLYVFANTVLHDKELMKNDGDVQTLREDFPRLIHVYEELNCRWNLVYNCSCGVIEAMQAFLEGHPIPNDGE